MLAVIFVERVLKIDDPVGAVSVHGFNGAWGVLSLGLFADGTYGDGWNSVKGTVTGLFYGDGGQFAAQCIGILANIVYVGVIGYVAFKLLDVTVGLRVDPSRKLKVSINTKWRSPPTRISTSAVLRDSRIPEHPAGYSFGVCSVFRRNTPCRRGKRNWHLSNSSYSI